MDDTVRIGINGFGRIGRATLRTALGRDGIDVVAINDVVDVDDLAYLIQYDTNWGPLEQSVTVEGGDLVIGDEQRIHVSQATDPGEIPWGAQDVDLAIEATGQFRQRSEAARHLDAGAQTVLISAPPTGDQAVPQYVYGVNHTEYDGEAVISGASCTTNSVTPPLSALMDTFGVESANMTTIHAYTRSQNVVDGPASKTRRGRAAAENVVPTSTGAASATTEILPELEGAFEGTAVRVPVPSGSITELVLDLNANPSASAVNDTLVEYANGPLNDAMGVTRDPIVSSDVIGTEYGSYVDLEKTNVVGDGDLVTLFSWYDNEIGYSSQLLHLADFVVSERTTTPERPTADQQLL